MGDLRRKGTGGPKHRERQQDWRRDGDREAHAYAGPTGTDDRSETPAAGGGGRVLTGWKSRQALESGAEPNELRSRFEGSPGHRIVPGELSHDPREFIMPATSKSQQKAAGAALSAKRGDSSKASLKGASKSMYDSMSEKQLEDFAATKRKGLPAKKSGGNRTQK